VEFAITPEQERWRDRCLELAADFASRSTEQDRDATHPIENYDRPRREGFLHLTIPKRWGGSGHDFLSHTIAYEALGRGCPSTALAFTRVALTLGGAHGMFKGSRLEQLFRDGALAEIQPPPSDFCLWNIGLHELNLDPASMLPPMRPL